MHVKCWNQKTAWSVLKSVHFVTIVLFKLLILFKSTLLFKENSKEYPCKVSTLSLLPQTKFAKVMFLHVSVILFTGVGGLQAHTWREVEGSDWGGGVLQAHTQGSGWGVLQAQARGVCIPACTEADTPPADGYSSYWNAFLLYICPNFDCFVS